ncbi:transient receptor potential channel pyrexia-like [Nilaparvata lugens]|uniref:transient receptor potential channel pyrexia-like n=1 Tax=Nilaparvata lugens TaxID=108931 RepID=UPI00193C9506|nr:transient receptor potential channel pyrexia-like [Nilaparvata lugens]
MAEEGPLQITVPNKRASQQMYYDTLVKEVNDLMSAIEMLSHQKVESILALSRDSGRLVNCTCGSLRLTPLQLAASLINYPNKMLIVKMLLDHGARIHDSDKFGRTALYYAAAMGSDEEVKLLLEKGANPNTRCTLKVQDDTVAENVPFAKEESLPEKFEPPKIWGRTPLHKSVLKNQVLCCQLLLEKRATVNALDSEDSSPLLLAGIRLPIDDKDQLQRYESIVELLVNNGADVNVIAKGKALPPLFQAVALGSQKATSILIGAGASLAIIHENSGKNIFHMAVESGQVSTLRQVLNHQNDIKNYVNLGDFEGSTPLHQAAYQGNAECLRILINNGGDLANETTQGLSVVYAIYQHIPRPTEFLIDLLDSKIICHQAPEKNDNTLHVELDFRILAPRSNSRQMSVVSLLTAEQRLIQHPLIEAFIHVKWKKMRWLFFFIFVLQVCFVLSLSSFSLMLVNPEWCIAAKTVGSILRKIIRVLLFMSSLFLNLHNFLEIRLMSGGVLQLTEPSVNLICYGYGVFMAWTVDESDIYTSNKISLLTHVASLVIVTAWGSLMFQLGRFPSWGYYGLMFSAVLSNVFKVMSTGICMFIGFVLCFWIQFPNKFKGVWNPFIRMLIMMTGELNDEFFFSYDNESKEMQCSRLVFVVFIVLASIVLTNLMLGLAVNDVQALQLEGHAKHLIKQTEFIVHLERLGTLRAFHSRLFPTRLRQKLQNKHHVQTRLYVKDPASVHASNALPERIMDNIVPIARAKRIRDKRDQRETVFVSEADETASQKSANSNANPTKSMNQQPVNFEARLSRVETLNEYSQEIVSMFKEIKQMLASIKEQETRSRSNTLLSNEEHSHGALLRKLSHIKRK